MSDKTLKQKQQTQNKERQAYAFYVSQGWTPEQAIGIVGNLIRESNLNTTIVGTADDKGSQGIAQWHGDRLKTLKSKYGNNWTDFRNQLEFVDWELKNTEKSAGDKLKNAKGVWEAGTIVSDHYERPKVKFVGDEKRQSHVSDLAMKFKGIKLTPEDMPYYGATYANSVAPYMNQQKEAVTPTINNLQIPQQTTTFASVPDSAEDGVHPKETKTEETDKDVAEVEQKTKEFNFLDELNTTASFFKPREKQQIEAPQTDYMQQYEQISQFIENPQVAQQGKKFKLQDERNLVVRDNTPNTKRDLSLMLAEYNNAKKDKQELRTTGQIKNPNSIQYRRNIKTQPDIKQDNISTEQRNAPLNPLQRPLIYLANPEKVLGDLGVPGMETSELDRQAINANRFNPYQSGTDRFLNNAKIGLGYVPEATVNTALAAAFMPEGSGALGLVNETLNPLAGIKTSIPDELRQGLNSQGFLDMFKKAKPEFKSEINWGEWNKEIPENTQLIKEYNTIEQQAKANNTWMKNPDGSTFQGTPEQFVQQNSENFKKSFGNTQVRDKKGNIQITNHSTFDNFDTFDMSKFGKTDDGFYGKGAYFHPNTNTPKLYGDIDMNSYINIENPMPHDNHFFFGREGKGAYWDSIKNEQVKIDDVSSLWKDKYDGYITNHGEYPLNDYNATEYVTNIPTNIKSAIGNNGMFDMNNPNIYKSVVPIAGASYLATQGQEQNPPQYQQGGQQKFTENELAFLSEIAIKDNNGQRSHPNKVTKIEGNVMATDGYGDIPLYVIPNKGKPKVVNANTGQHKFKGATEFIEIPLFKK